MTNQESRQLLIEFMRRHNLNDSKMAELLGRNRFWVCRARNNSTGKSDDAGDFNIPRIVTNFLQLFDLMPVGIQQKIIAGQFPDPTPDISLARIRPDEVAEHQAMLDDAGSQLLQRFALVLNGSSADVLRRATNQLVALEMAKTRSERTYSPPQAAE
ncbi:MAG: hypothetical protein ACFHHU_00725 [Porticoccaceae bacterium]